MVRSAGRNLLVENYEQATVVSLSMRRLVDGDVVDEVARELNRLASKCGSRELLLNLGEMEHLSSLALSHFIKIGRIAANVGGKLTLCNPLPSLQETFRTTRLDQVLHIRTGVRFTTTKSGVTSVTKSQSAIPVATGDNSLEHWNDEQILTEFARHGLMTRSSAMLEVFRCAVRASELNDVPVLIVGETGTGKQRIAEAIHKIDRQRCNRAFFPVNCGCINSSLAESMLFGHAKGAFTGADREHLGFFRAANGGTLLLDEVGELGLELQVKLLRVLDSYHLLPIGKDFEERVDVRVIAATNRPLEQMVGAGQFRADLYYRLNVCLIRVPPLRERPEDIDLQARYFLQKFQGRSALKLTDFSEDALAALRRLPWGGNTRQLENMVRQTLVAKPQGPLVELSDLPESVIRYASPLGSLGSFTGATSTQPNQQRSSANAEVDRVDRLQVALDMLVSASLQENVPLQQLVDKFERRLLEFVLHRNEGSRAATANQFGFSYEALRKKLKKYCLR